MTARSRRVPPYEARQMTKSHEALMRSQGILAGSCQCDMSIPNPIESMRTPRKWTKYSTKTTQCTCEHCGSKFERSTSEVARGKAGRFCSKSCSNLARDYKSRPPQERFWARVDKSGSCWLWTGYVTENGYGQFGQSTVSGDNEYAHRYSYKISHGPIPEGSMVLHKCDVRTCVRPDHLYLGTAKQNTADMDARGRRGKNARLPPEIVRAIRSTAGSHTQIARRFDLSLTCVSNIRSGRRRKDV